MKLRISKLAKKVVKFLKKVIASEDFKAVKNFLFYVLILGSILNLGLVFFGFKFSLINLISLGSLLWIIESKISLIIKTIIHR